MYLKLTNEINCVFMIKRKLLFIYFFKFFYSYLIANALNKKRYIKMENNNK